jgi:hypothetical protein
VFARYDVGAFAREGAALWCLCSVALWCFLSTRESSSACVFVVAAHEDLFLHGLVGEESAGVVEAKEGANHLAPVLLHVLLERVHVGFGVHVFDLNLDDPSRVCE